MTQGQLSGMKSMITRRACAPSTDLYGFIMILYGFHWLWFYIVFCGLYGFKLFSMVLSGGNVAVSYAGTHI